MADPIKPRSQSEMLKVGLWRGEIELENRFIVPFHFEVNWRGGQLEVHYINGPERMQVEQVVYHGGASIQLKFPSYAAEVEAEISENKMTGVARWRKPHETHAFLFTAEFDRLYRIHKTAPKSYADISGRWAVDLDYGGEGDFQPALAEFDQNGPIVTGTIETPYGDFRFLSGEINNRDFHLSVFDGGHVMTVKGCLNENGDIEGHAATLSAQPFQLRAHRKRNIDLPDISLNAGLKDENETFNFSFPNLDGQMVSLSNPIFQGKVTVVILAGSWCPTCHDHSAFFVPFYHELHDRGLEAITVMFEFSDELEIIRHRLHAYKERYDIPFEMVFAGHCAPDRRGKWLPQLKAITAFPTAILIDRSGNVHDVIPSFKGPATGAKHTAFVKSFQELIEGLL